MQERLREVAEVLATAKSVFEKAEVLLKRLASHQLKPNGFRDYLELVFPRSREKKQSGKLPDRWVFLQKVFETAPDLQLPGVKGTLWAAYNAITRFEDYKQSREDESPDERLERAWFGTSAETKLLALEKAEQLATAG
jgi:hypothetical protein